MADTLSFAKITSLALADAVNPCVLAILTIVLITILTQNPEKKKRVLYAGIAFTASIFIGYIIYGFVIIQVFKTFADKISGFSFFLYKALAVFAMLVGALNIKDYFMYQPGGIATEMPISIRPRVKELIKKMTSPSGAFFIGIFVTIFLLPCTIGPYIIASGLLSEVSLFTALPWLIYYNFLFVVPMIGIIALVYIGFTTVEDVSGWKERNIRRLHLVAGTLLFIVGLSLLTGWL
jgi:cytochrome c biogenesis protein CcdA